MTDIVLGLAMIGIALTQLERRVTTWNALAFGITLVADAATVYSF